MYVVDMSLPGHVVRGGYSQVFTGIFGVKRMTMELNLLSKIILNDQNYATHRNVIYNFFPQQIKKKYCMLPYLTGVYYLNRFQHNTTQLGFLYMGEQEAP